MHMAAITSCSSWYVQPLLLSLKLREHFWFLSSSYVHLLPLLAYNHVKIIADKGLVLLQDYQLCQGDQTLLRLARLVSCCWRTVPLQSITRLFTAILSYQLLCRALLCLPRKWFPIVSIIKLNHCQCHVFLTEFLSSLCFMFHGKLQWFRSN